MSEPLRFRDLLSWRGRVGPATPEFREWLVGLAIPGPILQLFDACSLWEYDRPPEEDFDTLRFNSEDDIMSENESITMPLRDGLLVIGSLPAGDRIALDVRDRVGAVGFIEHGGLWHAEDVRDVYIEIAASLDEMAALRSEGKLPDDYSEAKDRG